MASTEVRITAETIASGLHRESHDLAHAQQAEAMRRESTVRASHHGVEVSHTILTGTGILVFFKDNTRGFFSRDTLASMVGEG